MTQSGQHRTIIQRKIATSDRGAKGQQANLWGQIIQRAGQMELDMHLVPGRRHAQKVTLENMHSAMDGMALCVFYLDQQGNELIIVLDPATLSAIVEIQTIGRVIGRACDGRSPSQLDFALTLPFLDRVIGLGVQNELWPHPFKSRQWVQNRAALTGVLNSPNWINLVMSFRLGETDLSGKIVIAQSLISQDDTSIPADQISKDCPQIVDLPVPFRAVLGKVKMTLNDLAQITAGDHMVMPLNCLSEITLVGVGAGQSFSAGLGKSNGRRAVQVFIEPRRSQPNTPQTAVAVPELLDIEREEVIEQGIDDDWFDALGDLDNAAEITDIDGVA